MWTNIFAAALGLAGGLTLLLVVKSVIETFVFIRASNRAEGTVIRYETTSDKMHLPVFQYRTNDGSAYEYTSSIYSEPPVYQIGETATIFYLKKNPRQAKLNSFMELWLVKIVFTLFGLISCGFAAGFFLG